MKLDERLVKNNNYYDRFSENVKARTQSRDYSRAFAKFTSLIPERGSILDIGCGTGEHLAHFASLGYQALGIEPSPRMRDICIEQGLQAIEGTFETLPQISIRPVDGVWAAASVLHVPVSDLTTTFSNVRELLKKDAPFFLTVRLGEGSSWDRYDAEDANSERFIQLFNEAELSEALTAGRFTIAESWTEQSTWGRPAQWSSIVALAA